MAESDIQEERIVANDDDLDRILSQSDAIIGSLNKLDGDASVQCNGTSTIDLTSLDSGVNTSSAFGVNNGPAAAGSQSRVGTLTTCVSAVRTHPGSIAVRAGVCSGQSVPAQTVVQAARNPVQPNRLIPTPVGAVVNGRLPSTGNQSNIVTMLMRPSASGPGNVAAQLRLGVGRTPGGSAVPTSSVQVVNVGVTNRTEPRLVAVTGGVMPPGVRFIQSSPQQPHLQQQQVCHTRK